MNLTSIKAFIAFIGIWLSMVLGGWDVALKVLVAFVVLDYITGVTAAWYEKKLSSSIGLWGIAKKIILFIPVAMGLCLDNVLSTDILRNIAIWFYIANEGLSILENMGRMGIPIPRPILDALQQLKKKSEPDAEAGAQ